MSKKNKLLNLYLLRGGSKERSRGCLENSAMRDTQIYEVVAKDGFPKRIHARSHACHSCEHKVCKHDYNDDQHDDDDELRRGAALPDDLLDLLARRAQPAVSRIHFIFQ